MSKRSSKARRQRRAVHIQADALKGKMINLSAGSACSIVAASGSEGTNARPKISMVAYTGGTMDVGFGMPVVVDLDGLRISAKNRPLLANHRSDQVVGHTTAISKAGGQITVEGVMSGANAITDEIVGSARNGFPWEASIGATMLRREIVRAGTSVKVNGRTFQGPLIVARETELKEISVVALGADDATTTSIAARRREADRMNEFEKWLKAEGWDPELLSDKQRKTLEAAWKAEKSGGNHGGDGSTGGATVTAGEIEESLNNIRAAHANEHKRIAKLTQICEGYPSILATAIESKWSEDKAALEVMKADRPTVNGLSRPSKDDPNALSAQVLEAGLCASVGMPSEIREKLFKEQTLEAARPFESIGLQELARLSCHIDRVSVPPIFGDEMINASFSTTSLPAILENVLNKMAMIAYRSGTLQALEIAKLTSSPDFKPGTRVRMLGTGKFGRVGQSGELESGTISDQRYPIQADTFGQIIFIDRQTMINDDLNMLNDAASEMGNQGREVQNELVFTELLSAPNTYFTAENTITGAGSALDATSLNAAATKFKKQKAGPDSKAKARDQRPINIEPAILLVPPELEVTAQILVGSNDIRPGGGNSADREGNFNPYRGRYKVVVAPHLSDEAFPGFSTTAWYLMADPNRLPALELTYLRGRREPRIERVSPPANHLGVGFRGYLDVGAARMDPKGIVKATGAA